MTDEPARKITLYTARWIVPVSAPPIENGAIAVGGETIVAMGRGSALAAEFPAAELRDLGNAAVLPGLINAHSHLELTVMRGFLEREEGDFLSWLRKLTTARREQLSSEDLYISAAWGACEAIAAGITCVADASDSGYACIKALRDVGLRATVFQESFGPDPQYARENFEKLKAEISRLREFETLLVSVGVSPHAVYTVSGPQLELISDFALAEDLPLMMHAAESAAEEMLVRQGRGPFAEGFAKRGFSWSKAGVSTIQYLRQHGILETRPLLAHCINVDESDIALIELAGAKVAHCPRSNAKLAHGRAPLNRLLKRGVAVGLGSDSVASNNSCDILEEARFAILSARADTNISPEFPLLSATAAIRLATLGGACAVGRKGQTGELKPGQQADFAAFSLDHRHQLPSYEPLETLVFASSGRETILTVVAGREVYREGRVTTIDEDRLRGRMGEIAERLKRS